MKNIQTHPVLITTGIVIILAAAMHAQSIINPLLMAFFVSIICVQPILWLKKKRLSQGLAVTIVIGGIFLLYLGTFELFTRSISIFIKDAPKYAENWNVLRASTDQVLTERGIDIAIFEGGTAMDPSKIMQYTSQLLDSFSEVMGQEITFLFLTIFLLAELNSVHLKFEVFSKTSKRSIAHLESMSKSIQHYLSIKTVASLMTGLFIGIFLAIIGVDYAILWALVAFLLNYIPNIGSIIAAIPAVLFATLQLGVTGALWTAAVFVVVNMVIGNVIEPKIMGKGLGLSTFVVFFGLIFWGFILGPVGMFLSVPLMMVIKIWLEQRPNTQWIATMLGTDGDAERALEKLAE
jgi:predicted PurR-regulated permease PerM